MAMDPLFEYTKRVSRRIKAAGLGNVRVLKRDALISGLDDSSKNKVLLFGALPFPLCP